MLNLISIFINSHGKSRKGFRPSNGTNDVIQLSNVDFIICQEEYEHLEKMVSICKENGVKIIFIESPVWNKCPDFSSWIKEYSIKNSIPYIEENSNNEYFNHPELFYDISHLNSQGADFFTRNISEEINCLFNNKE